MRIEQEGGFEAVTRHFVMAKDLNPAGTLYGGTMLAWLDEASAIHVMRRIGTPGFVTAAVDEVNFRAPARNGDIVTVFCRIVKMGRSSVTTETRAIVEEPATRAERETITCAFTFVCLKDGRPYPYFQSPEYQEWREANDTCPPSVKSHDPSR